MPVLLKFKKKFKFKADKSFKYKVEFTTIRKMNKKTSLILLKKKALKLDFTVPLLVLQKFIKKNEDKPIDSQPKNNVNKLFPNTKTIILNMNQLISKAKISSLASNFI